MKPKKVAATIIPVMELYTCALSSINALSKKSSTNKKPFKDNLIYYYINSNTHKYSLSFLGLLKPIDDSDFNLTEMQLGKFEYQGKNI